MLGINRIGLRVFFKFLLLFSLHNGGICVGLSTIRNIFLSSSNFFFPLRKIISTPKLLRNNILHRITSKNTSRKREKKVRWNWNITFFVFACFVFWGGITRIRLLIGKKNQASNNLCFSPNHISEKSFFKSLNLAGQIFSKFNCLSYYLFRPRRGQRRQRTTKGIINSLNFNIHLQCIHILCVNDIYESFLFRNWSLHGGREKYIHICYFLNLFMCLGGLIS